MNKPLYFYALLMAFIVTSFGIFTPSCSPTYAQGEALYQAYCANCHMDEGEGLRGLFPPLAQSDYLVKYRAELPCIIRHGLDGSIEVNGKTYDQPMAAIPSLNETEIHNILNYINRAWGNDLPYFQPREIKAALKKCQ